MLLWKSLTRVPLQVYLAYAVVAVLLYKTMPFAIPHSQVVSRGFDFLIFYVAARRLLEGDFELYNVPSPAWKVAEAGSYYSGTLVLPNHPPALYWLLEPLTTLPFYDALALLQCTLYMLGFLGLFAVHRCLKLELVPSIVLTSLAFFGLYHSSMNIDNLGLGQLGMAVLVCFTGAFCLSLKNRPGWCGLFLSLAAICKGWPLTVFGYFLTPGLRKHLVAGLSWLAAIIGLEVLVHGPKPIQGFLAHTDNLYFPPSSQSLLGVACNSYHLDVASARALNLGILGLISIVTIVLWLKSQPCQSRLARLFFFCAFGLIGNLFAPHSVPYHLMWIWMYVISCSLALRKPEQGPAALLALFPALCLLVFDGECSTTEAEFNLRRDFHMLGGGFFCRGACWVASLALGWWLARQPDHDGALGRPTAATKSGR